VVCCQLTACANYADQAEDEGEDPAGTAVKAMAATDNESHNHGWEENTKFQDGNTTSRVELHYE
jgi:hypothetical protein